MNGLADIFAYLGPWTWWVVAGILFTLELMAPGVFFLWLGAAAVIVGTLVLFIDISWQWQVAAFAVLSVVTLVLSRRYFTPKAIETDQPLLNKRFQKLVGRSFVLDVPIVNGTGRLKVGDSVWSVEGPDLPAGSRVKVTEVDGATLKIAPDELASG